MPDGSSQTTLSAANSNVRAALDALSALAPVPQQASATTQTPLLLGAPLNQDARDFRPIDARDRRPIASTPPKFYGVRNGKQGSRVYDNWAEAGPATHSPNCVHKRFNSRQEAEDFIA